MDGSPERSAKAFQVTLQVTRAGTFFVGSLNLYADRARAGFIGRVAARFRGQVPKSLIEEDLFALIDELEARVLLAGEDASTPAPVMTPDEEREARTFLDRSNLTHAILDDLTARTLTVRQGKGRKDRLLPLGRYLRESAPLRRQQGTDRVFLTPKGRSLSNWVLNETIRRHAKAAGITRRVSAHALRHPFATQLIRGGADVRKVQRLLGHELLITTQLYTHLDVEDLRKVQDRYHPRERRRR